MITQNIVDGFARLAPEKRAAFEKNRQAFLQKLEGAMDRWTEAMAPVRRRQGGGLSSRFHLLPDSLRAVQSGALEDRPGIPPSPSIVVQIIRQMKAERIKVILVEPWND